MFKLCLFGLVTGVNQDSEKQDYGLCLETEGNSITLIIIVTWGQENCTRKSLPKGHKDLLQK